MKSTYIHVLSSVQLGQSSYVCVKWRAKLEGRALVSSISQGCNFAGYTLSCLLTTDQIKKSQDIIRNPEVHSCVHRSFQTSPFQIHFIPFHHFSMWSNLISSSHLNPFNGYRDLFNRRYSNWRFKQTAHHHTAAELRSVCACPEWLNASSYEMEVFHSWPNALPCLLSPRELWKPKEAPIIFYALS